MQNNSLLILFRYFSFIYSHIQKSLTIDKKAAQYPPKKIRYSLLLSLNNKPPDRNHLTDMRSGGYINFFHGNCSRERNSYPCCLAQSIISPRAAALSGETECRRITAPGCRREVTVSNAYCLPLVSFTSQSA